MVIIHLNVLGIFAASMLYIVGKEGVGKEEEGVNEEPCQN